MRRTSRAAFTLVEMLVAMAVTLVMMGAVVTLFGNIGNSISGSRASMEQSERLRNARNVLQHDLGNITVTTIPSRRPEMDEGYLEIIEGPMSDRTTLPPTLATGNGLFGDLDDILLFTVRSKTEPYVGTVNNTAVQSQTAQVAWYTAESDTNIDGVDDGVVLDPAVVASGLPVRLKTLFRRVLLVAPAQMPTPVNASGRSLIQFYEGDRTVPSAYNGTDLSVRRYTDGTNFFFAPCGLGDLTKRENRFGHDNSAYPFRSYLHPSLSNAGHAPLKGDRRGDDVILTNVLSFDVKVYDPNVPVLATSSGVATLPSDPGYGSAGSSPAGTGGYVDLFYNRNLAVSLQSNTAFSGPGNAQSGLDANGTFPAATYDTWSMHYDAAGIAFDGLDNGGAAGIVDDPAESTAPPPYPVPLRGIQIKIRVYEPDSRQVREVTVVQDFLPQ